MNGTGASGSVSSPAADEMERVAELPSRTALSGKPGSPDFEAFRAFVSQSFVPMHVSSLSPGSFRSRVRSAEADGLHLSEIVASTHSAFRFRRHIDPHTAPYLKVNVQLGGTGLLVQDEREAVLRAGDLAVYDTQRPFSLAFDGDSRSLVIMLPRDAIDLPAEALLRLTAVTFSGDEGIGKLVNPLLTRLGDNLDQLRGPSGPRLAHNVLDLISTLLTAELVGAGGRGDPNQRLFQRMLDYIDVHLGDDDLTPDKLAAVHFVSKRRLYGIFQAQGTTVASWVRRRRLERCCRDLRDPSLADCPIAMVGARWGFPDSAHFCRVFKAHLGLTPREFRTSVLA